jgi:hypothetical protein
VNIFAWNITFEIPEIETNLFKEKINFSDIVNWVKNQEPVAYIAIRDSHSLDHKYFEFGFYDKRIKEWENSRSPDFLFSPGKYRIICNDVMNYAHFTLFFNEEEKVKWKIEKSDFVVPDSLFWGDLVNNKLAKITNCNLNCKI